MTSAQPYRPVERSWPTQLAAASPDLLRSMLSTFIQALMGAEADAVCGAGYGERSAGAGQLPQRVPAPGLRHPGRHHRRGDPETPSGSLLPGLAAGATHTRRTRPGQRRRDLYLLGVSTRRVDKLVQALGVTALSKSQVSVMAKELDAQVEAFRHPPAGPGPVHVRGGRRAGPQGPGGRPGGPGPRPARDRRERRRAPRDPRHGRDHRRGRRRLVAFFRGLAARGLTGVKLVTSDAHAGLVAAIGATLPGACWQRCSTHYAVNLMAVTPKTSAGRGCAPCCTRSTTSSTRKPLPPSSTGSSTHSPRNSPRWPTTSTRPAPT